MTVPPRTVATTLPPAGRVLWRSAREAQVEVGGRRVVLDGVGAETIRRLLGRAAAPVDAVGADADPGAVGAVQQHLIETGFLWPVVDAEDDLRRFPPRLRLDTELTALSARAGERAAELLHARRHCGVVVEGAGRAGAHVAAVLAAAGVGRVRIHDRRPVRLHQAVPGGVEPADEGRPLAEAAEVAVQRHAPEVDSAGSPPAEAPDLVVLALDEPLDPERRAGLHASGRAHLLVELSGGRASVGPLVLPGLTSCLGCADLHRLDRDPAWNALAVQLTLPHRGARASEVALATTVAGMAATQVLEFLDGGQPAAIEGSLELCLPDWRVRRRTWPPHPDCDCMGPA